MSDKKLRLGDLCGRPIPPKQFNCSSPILSAAGAQQIGIEFEIENMRRGQPNLPHGWREDEDNSLRGGIELKTDGPVLAKFAEHKIRDAIDWLNVKGATTSIRTGLHVHLDAQNLDVSAGEPISFLMAYTLVEPALYRYVGQDRQTLMFCQPLYHTPTIANSIRELFYADTVRKFNSARLSEELRYGGLNVTCLPSYGTVEFRHAAMSLNVQEVVRWVEMCVSIMKFAENMSPTVLADAIVSDSAAVVRDMMGYNAPLLAGPYNEALALTFLDGVVIPPAKLSTRTEDWERPLTEAHTDWNSRNRKPARPVKAATKRQTAHEPDVDTGAGAPRFNPFEVFAPPPADQALRWIDDDSVMPIPTNQAPNVGAEIRAAERAAVTREHMERVREAMRRNEQQFRFNIPRVRPNNGGTN